MNALVLIFAAVALLAIQDGCCYPTRLTRLENNDDLSNDLRDSNDIFRSKELRNNYVEIQKFPVHPIILEPGSRAMITCVAFGSPAPNIIWLKNDITIEEEIPYNELLTTSDRSYGSSTSSVLLDRVSSSPRDIYTCVASAGQKTMSKAIEVFAGVDDSSINIDAMNAGLERMSTKPTITEHFSLYLDAIGSTVILPCRASGNPRPKIEWRTERGNPIGFDGNRLRLLDNGDLLIRNLQWKDMGGYSCVATNENGVDKQEVFVYPFMANEKDTRK